MYNKRALVASGIFAFFLVGFMALVFFMQGCAPVKGLTNEQSNLLKFYSIYNSQYADYERQTADPSRLSEEKKVILRQKKEILTEMYRLIKLYELAVNMGNAEDTAKLEQEIFDLIDKL